MVSPYHGGSHLSWAEGLRRSSAHQIETLTLPARFWKWRMHGGAVTLARRFLEDGCSPDLLLVTDMVDLTTFLALTREKTAGLPVVLYMHENQLTYPLPDDAESGPMRRQGGERDQHYAFINWASMLAADAILFNSAYHRDALFAELPRFLRHFPEYNELGSIESLEGKSSVVPVGIDYRWLRDGSAGTNGHETATSTARSLDEAATGQPPLVIWNQRWEYDKNPAGFFAALAEVESRGLDFRLALCGESFSRQPSDFDTAAQRFGERLVHCGYAEPEEYRRLLWEATATASTAHHEFFGIGVLEAIACETFPVLPARLSYPEVLAAAGVESSLLERCLCVSDNRVVDRLEWALRFSEDARRLAKELAASVVVYDWAQLAPRYDAVFEGVRRD